MPDWVLDATVVGMTNTELSERRPGNLLDRRLAVIERVAKGEARMRYNQKLMGEYQRLTARRKNDLIDILFDLLDSTKAILVHKNKLTRQEFDLAKNKCGWPSHDQHLLAAAIGGVDPSIFVTERHHFRCQAKVLRHFRVHLEDLG
jgi:hypothetical protein